MHVRTVFAHAPYIQTGKKVPRVPHFSAFHYVVSWARLTTVNLLVLHLYSAKMARILAYRVFNRAAPVQVYAINHYGLRGRVGHCSAPSPPDS